MTLNRHLARDADEVIRQLGDLAARFSGAKVLVTGAAGFLGAHFVHGFLRLNDCGVLAEPCRLVAIDNFLRGVPSWLGALRERPDLELRQANIVQTQEFGPTNFIVHAASLASPTYYRQFPIETMDANVIGLRNLLEFARRQPVQGFLYFSTSEIYGDPDAAHIPTAETYRGNVSCTGPRACYDESKRFGETLCVAFAQVHKVPVVVVRPFNNYGPGLMLGDRRVLPDFFRDALKGKDITLLSDGTATRTFCYSSDAMTGYLRALLLGRAGESYNIGSDRPEISMRDLARQVVEVAGTGVGVSYRQSDDKHYLTDNPQRRCPDLGKARAELGYAPRVSLRDGLTRMLEYYRDDAE